MAVRCDLPGSTTLVKFRNSRCMRTVLARGWSNSPLIASMGNVILVRSSCGPAGRAAACSLAAASAARCCSCRAACCFCNSSTVIPRSLARLMVHRQRVGDAVREPVALGAALVAVNQDDRRAFAFDHEVNLRPVGCREIFTLGFVL